MNPYIAFLVLLLASPPGIPQPLPVEKIQDKAAPPKVLQEPLPKQVWTGLDDARREAAKTGRNLVLYLPEDETRYRSCLDFFRSREGMEVRAESEVWLAKPGNTKAAELMDEYRLRSLPALVHLSPSGKQVERSLLGEECAPLAAAFEQLLGPRKTPVAWLQDWVGKDQPIAPFQAFATARHGNLGAAAKEPHRTWLVHLLQGQDVRLKTWAATRLVEADAWTESYEPKAFQVLIDCLRARFENEVKRGNHYGANSNPSPYVGYPDPPLADLGRAELMDGKAPCWSSFRGFLGKPSTRTFTVAMYVMMAPNLKEEDRTWILPLLVRMGKGKEAQLAHNSAIYWIATDWLLAYGMPPDWDAFRSAMVPLAMDGDLISLMDQVKSIPGYWNSQPGLQAMFCEGESQESFWEHPDPCLAAWGVTREALVEFGLDRLVPKENPMLPRYPLNAKRSRISATLKLRSLVGPDGATKWVRPEPGFALSFFAPAGMEYAMKLRFEPARVAGVPRPSQFVLTMPFKLKI